MADLPFNPVQHQVPIQLTEDDDEGESDEELAPQPGVKPKTIQSRRKSHQKPEGADQMRQAFSKRKRGLVLKAYQLYKLTDSKVFLFIVNDKGNSWAYSTPGFGSILAADQIEAFRELAKASKPTTEVMTHPKMDAADLEVDDRSQFDITYPYDNVSNPHGNNQTQKPAQVAQPVPRGVKPRSGRAPPYHRLEGVDPFLPNPSLEDQTLPFVPNSSLPMDDLSFNIPGDLMNSIHAGRNPQVYGSAQMMSQELNMANFNPSRLNKMSARPDEPETQRPPPSKRQHVQANESPAGGGVGVWEGSLNQYGTSSSLPYPPNVSHYPSSILNPQQGFPGPSSIDEGLRNPSIPIQLYSGQGIPHNEGQQPIWALNQSISQGGSYGSRSVGGGGGGIVGGSLQGQVVQDSEGNLYRIIQDVVPMPNHHEQPLGLDNVSSLGQGGFGSDLTHGLPSQVPQSYTQQQQQQQPSSSFGFRPTTSQSTRGFSSQQ